MVAPHARIKNPSLWLSLRPSSQPSGSVVDECALTIFRVCHSDAVERCALHTTEVSRMVITLVVSQDLVWHQSNLVSD